MIASMRTMTRTMVLWCPDWPIVAVRRSKDLPEDAPIALVEKGEVYACSATARAEGVRRGQRMRDAQARCPGLTVLPAEQAVEARVFAPIVEAIERTMPGVQVIRPGLCAIRAHGPAQFYGGEEEAALWLFDALDALGVHGSRIGVADGPFTAVQAAHASTASRIEASRITIVPEGGSAHYIAPLSVSWLGDRALIVLLRRLGVATLGDFAALSADDVAGRFGPGGARLHALAGGADSSPVVPRIPPREFDVAVAFEPPLDRVDQATFGVRAAADRFIEQLTGARLVCTALRIEVEAERGAPSERSWLHPHSFTAADVVDRLRWQLQGSSTGPTLDAGIVRVRVVPEGVDSIGNHERGLWGGPPDERVHHGLSRVQSMLGHDAVLTPVIAGGRTIRERGTLVPWGDRPAGARPAGQPWPGHLPDPAPSSVFESPRAVLVLADGDEVTVDARGALSAEPTGFSPDGGAPRAITAWTGPWTVDERWWDPATARRMHRFQVVDDTGAAWLLVLEHGRWWAEGSYD